MSQMVERVGLVDFTQQTRDQLPVWEVCSYHDGISGSTNKNTYSSSQMVYRVGFLASTHKSWIQLPPGKILLHEQKHNNQRSLTMQN